jgi:hypothetical protein
MGAIRSDFAAIVEAVKDAPAPVEEQLGLF